MSYADKTLINGIHEALHKYIPNALSSIIRNKHMNGLSDDIVIHLNPRQFLSDFGEYIEWNKKQVGDDPLDCLHSLEILAKTFRDQNPIEPSPMFSDEKVKDALLVDFINVFAVEQLGMDYGLYTKDIFTESTVGEHRLLSEQPSLTLRIKLLSPDSHHEMRTDKEMEFGCFSVTFQKLSRFLMSKSKSIVSNYFIEMTFNDEWGYIHVIRMRGDVDLFKDIWRKGLEHLTHKKKPTDLNKAIAHEISKTVGFALELPEEDKRLKSLKL